MVQRCLFHHRWHCAPEVAHWRDSQKPGMCEELKKHRYEWHTGETVKKRVCVKD